MQTTYSDATFRVGKATYQGTRANQEDSFFAGRVVPNKPWLGVISDGMGGHQAGDIASRLGVQVVRETFDATAKSGIPMPAALKNAVESAHRAVLRKAEALGQSGNMGATVVAFSVVGDTLFWCSAGDSRLYIFRGERLSQLTRDFTLAADLENAIKGGHVSKEAVEANPQKAALTSFLGTDNKFRTDDGSIRLRTGDFIVGCTDGVYGTVGAGGISAACSRASGFGDQAAEIAVDTLFGEFLFPQQKENQDNSTAIVLSFDALSGAGHSVRVASGWSSAFFHPYSKLAIAILALVGFVFVLKWSVGEFMKPRLVAAHSEPALPKAPGNVPAKETDRQEAKPPAGESIDPSSRDKPNPSANDSSDAGRLSVAKEMLAKAKQASPESAQPLIEQTIEIANGLSGSRNAKIREEAKSLLSEAKKIKANKLANVIRKIDLPGQTEFTNVPPVPSQSDPSAAAKPPLDSKGNSPLPTQTPGRGPVVPSDTPSGEAKQVGRPGTEKAATTTPPSVTSNLQRSSQQPVAAPDAATTGMVPIRDSVAPSTPVPIGAVPANSKGGASDTSGNSREKQ